MSACLYVIMNLFMYMRCVHGTARMGLCPSVSVCECLLPLSIRARRQKLFSGELVQFSMKMRFAGPRVPDLLCRVCVFVCLCGL